MRCLAMFKTAACLIVLLKLKWPKNKSVQDKIGETKVIATESVF